LPDAFTLKIKDLEFFYNVAASNGSRMDWKALAANSTDGFNLGLGALALMDNSVEFRVAGSVMVAIENFVYVSGSVALQRKELFVKTVGSSNDDQDVDIDSWRKRPPCICRDWRCRQRQRRLG
jgi:hypothetical protein